MAKKKNAPLGRGLEALLDDFDLPEMDHGQVFHCPVKKIHPNPLQPRSKINRQDLADLSDSIKKRGILQPIIVKPVDGQYQIIAGERRWRAATLAGFEKVPVIAREVTDEEQLFLALIENLQRRDLHFLEEAKAYDRLRKEFGLTQEEISKQVGKDRSTVANLLRLLDLPIVIQQQINAGNLSMGHARAILALHDEEKQIDIVKRIVKKKMSVRDSERLVKEIMKPGPKRRIKTSNYKPAEKTLRNILKTKVTITKKGNIGRISIEFRDDSELERLIEYISFIEKTD